MSLFFAYLSVTVYKKTEMSQKKYLDIYVDGNGNYFYQTEFLKQLEKRH